MAQKHGLKNDGAPFDDDGKPVNSDKSTKGDGRGVCICGAHSGVEQSRAARKRWYDWHKNNLPAERSLEEELAEIVENDGTLTVSGEAGPPREEEDDLIGDKEPHLHTEVIPWTKDLAGIFWGVCGNLGSRKVLAAYHPDVTVKAESADKVLYLTGPEAEVEAAEITVLTYWATAANAFKLWKRETPAYKDRDQTDPAQRRVGYQLTKGFFTDFADRYAAGKVNTA